MKQMHMTSKITDQQKDELIDLNYNQRGFHVGIKKMFELLREKEPDAKISDRYLANRLELQPSYQMLIFRCLVLSPRLVCSVLSPRLALGSTSHPLLQQILYMNLIGAIGNIYLLHCRLLSD